MEVTISKSNYTFTDVSSWLDSLDQTYQRACHHGWEFIYILVAGLDQFGRTDHAKMELYELAHQQTGLSVKTLQDYASTARKPTTRLAIELGLEKGHAKAVLGLDNDEAEAVLTEAAEQGLSVESTRWLARQRKDAYRDDTKSDTQPGRTLSPPSAYATRNDYRTAPDDIDDRAEYLAAAPDAYDEDDVPFSHHRADEPPVIDELWSDERIDAMVQSVAIEATDADNVTWRTVLADDVCRLLRTMRSEYEAVLSRC